MPYVPMPYTDVLLSLPTGRDPTSITRRRALFTRLDTRDSGRLSLVELQQGLPEVRGTALRNALQVCKTLMPETPMLGPGLLEWKEFRLFLVVLKRSHELMVSFGRTAMVIDGQHPEHVDDRRMTLADFKAGLTILHAWGVTIRREDVDDEFHRLDSHGFGSIDYDDFVGWATAKSINADGDDVPKSPLPSSPHRRVEPSPTRTAFEPVPTTRSTTATTSPARGRSPRAVTPGGRSFPIESGGATPQATSIVSPRQTPSGSRMVDWERLARQLPTGVGSAASARRAAVFNAMDTRGIGLLSLAEVDTGIRELLGLGALFASRPILLRAFQAAKASKPPTAASQRGSEDFVEQSDFRRLLVHLKQYLRLHMALRRVDESDDRRISISEVREAGPFLRAWGLLRLEDVDRAFLQMDSRGGGLIDFEQFAEWAYARGVVVGISDRWAADEEEDDWPPDDIGAHYEATYEAFPLELAPPTPTGFYETMQSDASSSEAGGYSGLELPTRRPKSAGGARGGSAHNRTHEYLYALHQKRLMAQAEKERERDRQLTSTTSTSTRGASSPGRTKAFSTEELRRSVGEAIGQHVARSRAAGSPARLQSPKMKRPPRPLPGAPPLVPKWIEYAATAGTHNLPLTPGVNPLSPSAATPRGFSSFKPEPNEPIVDVEEGIPAAAPSPTAIGRTHLRGLTYAEARAESARSAASAFVDRSIFNSTTSVMNQPKLFPAYPDNGVPGPGHYEPFPALGQARSAPYLGSAPPPKEYPPPRSRGQLNTPITVAGGVAVHGALPDSKELQWQRANARANANTFLRVASRSRSPGPRDAEMMNDNVNAPPPSPPPHASSYDSGVRVGTAARVVHLAKWMETICGILPTESRKYADRLVALGCDAPSDLKDLDEAAFPAEIKMLHRRRLMTAAMSGLGL